MGLLNLDTSSTTPSFSQRRLRSRLSRLHLTMTDDLVRRLGFTAVIIIGLSITFYAFSNIFYGHKSAPVPLRTHEGGTDTSRNSYYQPNWSPPKQTTNFTASNWTFNPETDGRSYSLTEEQCDIAFPGLFTEIEQSTMSRLDRPITREELEKNEHSNSNTWAMIYDGDVSSHSSIFITPSRLRNARLAVLGAFICLIHVACQCTNFTCSYTYLKVRKYRKNEPWLS